MTFGQRIRDSRQSRGLSLDWVAGEAGISKTYLWEMEKGKADAPSAQVLERLADVFGTTMDHLWRGLEK